MLRSDWIDVEIRTWMVEASVPESSAMGLPGCGSGAPDKCFLFLEVTTVQRFVVSAESVNCMGIPVRL
jgi:hypothetical protein